MDKVGSLLNEPLFNKKGTNKYWLISEEIAKVTNTKPNRWLRLVKEKERICRRALDTLTEMKADNPEKYFLWLVAFYS